METLVVLSMSLSAGIYPVKTVTTSLNPKETETGSPSDGLKQHSCTGVLYKRVDENYCS